MRGIRQGKRFDTAAPKKKRKDKSRAVTPERAAQLDAALGLQLISIRLPKGMIEDYKLVAKIRGLIYQPLMREAMQVWIEEAKTNILLGLEFDKRQAISKPSQFTDKP